MVASGLCKLSESRSRHEGPIVFTVSLFVLPIVFLLTKHAVNRVLGPLEGVVLLEITNWIVTIFQALISTTVGIVVVSHCDLVEGDIIHGCRCSLVFKCLWFMCAYFVFDLACLILIDSRKPHNFKLHKRMIFWHHLILITAIFPALLLYRREGVGDTPLGFGLLTEASTPFVAVKNLLRIFGRKSSTNSVLLAVTYFIVRVAVFPFVLGIYSLQRQLSLVSTLTSLPLQCRLGTVAMFSMQLFWFSQIASNALRRSPSVGKDTAKRD